MVISSIMSSIRSSIKESITSDRRYYWKLNGTSYSVIPEMSFAGDFNIPVHVKTSLTSADWAICDNSNFSNNDGLMLIYVDDPDGLEVVCGKTASFDKYIFGGQSEICNDENNLIEIVLVGNQLSAYLNGSQLGSSFTVPIKTRYIGGNLFGGNGRYLTGVATSLGRISGITNTDEYPSGTAEWKMNTYAPDNGYTFTDSNNGVVMQLYNAVPDDFTTEL